MVDSESAPSSARWTRARASQQVRRYIPDSSDESSEIDEYVEETAVETEPKTSSNAKAEKAVAPKPPKAPKPSKRQISSQEIETMSIKDLCHANMARVGTNPLPTKRQKRSTKKASDMTNGASSSRAAPAAPVTSAGPRVRLVDGQIVLDEASLAIAGSEQAGDVSHLTEIEESHEDRHITSASFIPNRTGNQTWSPVDTALFYDGLRVFGTDFEMIARLFIARNRRQIRLKFKREENTNRAAIDAALKERKTMSDLGLTFVTGTEIRMNQQGLLAAAATGLSVLPVHEQSSSVSETIVKSETAEVDYDENVGIN
jgi:hypothetical protein